MPPKQPNGKKPSQAPTKAPRQAPMQMDIRSETGFITKKQLDAERLAASRKKVYPAVPARPVKRPRTIL